MNVFFSLTFCLQIKVDVIAMVNVSGVLSFFRTQNIIKCCIIKSGFSESMH